MGSCFQKRCGVFLSVDAHCCGFSQSVLALIHVDVNVYIHLGVHLTILLTRETTLARRAVRCVCAKETISYKLFMLLLL